MGQSIHLASQGKLTVRVGVLKLLYVCMKQVNQPTIYTQDFILKIAYEYGNIPKSTNSETRITLALSLRGTQPAMFNFHVHSL